MFNILSNATIYPYELLRVSVLTDKHQAFNTMF